MRTQPRSKTGPLSLSASSPAMITGEGVSEEEPYSPRPLPDRTTVALFGTEVEVPIAYCSQGEAWAFPTGISRKKTGEERAQDVVQQETSIRLEAESFMALPNPVEGQYGATELVVGVVSPSDLAKLPRGDGPTLPNLGWVTLSRALGATTKPFVLTLEEAWAFLGALEALDRNEDEWILRPIVLWSKSFSGA